MPWIPGPEGKWDGGRIWRGRDGTVTYWIRKSIRGRWHDFSTGATTARAAGRELDRLEADPEGYKQKLPDALLLTEKLVDEFVEAGRLKGNGEGRLWKKRHYMTWWRERLPGDLRRTTLAQLDACLRGLSDRGNPTNVAKAFWSFLQETGRAESNPTAKLKAPECRPAQLDRSKVIQPGQHAKILEHLGEAHRDLVTVLAGTGWHVSELERFCASGRIEYPDDPRDAEQQVHVLVCPMHKSGDVHRTIVSDEVEEAAFRALERGAFGRVVFYRAFAKACRDAELPAFGPGMFRHTIATNAIEQGTTPEAVSAFLGHRSSATTKRFYAVHALRPKIPTMR